MKRKKLGSSLEKPASPEKSPYQPTQREQIKLQEHQARKAADTAPRLKVQRASGPDWVGPDHPDDKVGYTLLRGRFETHGRGLKDGFYRWASAFKHPIFAHSAFPKNR